MLDPGSDAGLDRLFVAERRPMVRLAALMVGSRALAEEIVQDAFASVSERWDGLHRPGGYLRTAVVNGCARVLRRRSVEDRHRMVEPAVPDRPGPLDVTVTPLEVSLAKVAQREGAHPDDLAAQWMADNRDRVDTWLAAARQAAA